MVLIGIDPHKATRTAVAVDKEFGLSCTRPSGWFRSSSG